ncbi:SPOR domain-containing protein [Vibrio parahaemolyticus]|nr:SPOR domain-containing protein [Vibrio parahaemolyticus]EGR1381704.1 SPOR domain-containing protein [Vibrio parahaemolyticus]EHH1218041.1 SPOR domain-containing protein [Vibrio parahaemolyticus]EJS4020664.1 SPOR domain-containing protein [Vibrio parahaemolyticus]ELA7498289.1 SPOR domain-containing protein [Vibrio parahaemolyticus]
MEMKKAHLLSRIAQSHLSLGGLLLCAQLSTPVFADDFLCQATQASDKELPMLEASCPIGQGVWGKKVPQGGNDFYWIQCGLLPKPMPLAKAKPIYSKITTDVWMKPDAKGYRCLIGPYTEYAKASTDLRAVKTLSNFREAFIRVVGEAGEQAVKQTPSSSKSASVPKPKVAPKPVAPVVASRPDTEAFKASATKTTAQPVTAKEPKSSTTTKPVAKAKPAPSVKSNGEVEVRLRASLHGKTYVVPYLLDNQFYMEYGKPWNRLNYESSQQTCQQLGMSLATATEFKALRDSGVMEKNKWPLQLPYWGKDKKGLFADREPNKLTGTSLLNVMCVK